MDKQFAKLNDDISNALSQVDIQMRSNVAYHFEAPRIKAMIEEEAKTQARGILEAEVRPAVNSFRDDSLFIRTLARAQAYDFKAFQDLLILANGTNQNAELAKQAISEIERSLDRDRTELSIVKRVLWDYSGTNFYPGPFTTDELAARFSGMTNERVALNREAFVNTVRDAHQPLFLPSLVRAFTNETDLAVADRLASAISELTGKDFRPRDFAQITLWWNEHSSQYTNWPLTTLDSGLKDFSGAQYAKAAETFESVVAADPQADLSRAYAVVCRLEIGDTNRAATLLTNFAKPDARWAQWARAKADLEAGNVSNATVKLFAFSTNCVGGPQVVPSWHIYRKIDWGQFERLKATNAPAK